MSSRIDSLLQLVGQGGWRIELDSSTAVAHWRKACDLGILLGPVEWSLTLDTDETAISLKVVDPADVGRQLVSVTPFAIKGGWRWLSEPLLFDNGSIHVEISLPAGAIDPAVFHFSRVVCERFVSKSSDDKVRLVGLLEPGNDVGAFELAWQWWQDGALRRASLRTTILSTKMNLQQDFPRMVGAIREAFPAHLQLDLLRQTQWGLSSAEGSATLQSWLAVFESIETELLTSFERLMRRPRWKLESQEEWRRLERVKWFSPRREDEIARAVAEHPRRLFRVECPVLDADRPENRFAKHVAVSVRNDLRGALSILRGKTGVSEIYLEWMEVRLARWDLLCSRPFWRSIGEFKGLRQESLTLQRDVVYTGIQQGWHLLRRALEVALSGLTQGGIRSIDDLYELWCLVQMDRALKELGWTRLREDWPLGKSEWDDIQRPSERQAGVTRLGYINIAYPGESVALLYQAVATARPSSRADWEGFFATPVDQQPDFVLRHTTPDGDIATWVFDAKYRVETSSEKVRAAPSDAIHQLQRYRDALLVRADRPVREAWGGFVLFPGSATGSWQEHPQARSIDAVNIGAIPLRCDDPVDGYEALKAFLDRKFASRRVDTGFDEATPGVRGLVRA